MTREIKFRGKHVDNGEWVYGAFVPDALETPDNDLITWGFIRRYNRDIRKMETIEVSRESVGQYTGLCDKNGKKIYEGDIVVIPGQYIWFDDGKPNYRGTVEWIYSQWQVVAHCVNKDKRGMSDGINEGLNDIGYDEGDESCWEVIGNIYDNPELLEVEHGK